MREQILISLYRKNTHGRKSVRSTLFAERAIRAKSDFAICVERLEAALFFLIAFQPNFLVGCKSASAFNRVGGQSQWRLRVLTNKATGSKVDTCGEGKEQRKVCETRPGSRTPSTHKSTHEIRRLGRGMLQSSFRLLTCDLNTKRKHPSRFPK